MNANELRIGNYISWKNLKKESIEATVSLICDDGVMVYNDKASIPYKEIEPIPLTEEWLVKFGWGKEEDAYINNVGHKDIIFQYLVEAKTLYLEVDMEYIECDIKHVHQLQNLYFALTGSELETKEI